MATFLEVNFALCSIRKNVPPLLALLTFFATFTD